MRRLFLIACLALTVSFGSFTANQADADTLVFSEIYDSVFVPDFTTVTLPKFDPTLGTLDSVSIEVFGEGVVFGEVEDFAGDGGIASAGISGFVSVVSSPLLGPVDLDGFADYESPPVPGFFIPVDVEVAGGGGIIVDPSDFGFFLEMFPGDDLEIDVDYDSAFLDATPDFAELGSAEVFGGTVTVVYGFTPIPEPSTTALFALGMIGLAIRRRHSRVSG